MVITSEALPVQKIAARKPADLRRVRRRTTEVSSARLRNCVRKTHAWYGKASKPNQDWNKRKKTRSLQGRSVPWTVGRKTALRRVETLCTSRSNESQTKSS